MWMFRKIPAALLCLLLVISTGCGSHTQTVSPASGATSQGTSGSLTRTAAPASGATSQGTSETTAAPTAKPLAPVQELTAGQGYSMAVLTDGTLLAWGDPGCALYGNSNPYATPKQIDSGVSSVEAGDKYLLEIKQDGNLWVFGTNKDVCPIADGTPQKMLDGVASAAAGDGFVLAVKTDGTLWSWGNNQYGQLADGTETSTLVPKQVMGNVKKAAAGTGFSLILLNDGTLLGCGYNADGQLAGTFTKKIPWPGDTKGENIAIQGVPVKLLGGITDIAAGQSHTLAVGDDGVCWACGSNENGQIGDNLGTNTVFLPIPAGVRIDCPKFTKVLDGVQQVFANGNMSGAVKADGTVWMWGANLGGDGMSADARLPAQVLEGCNAVSLSSTHALAMKKNETLWSWGDNTLGELGSGMASFCHDWVKVTDDVKEVRTNGKTSFVLKKDGTLLACGYNGNGQLGDGTVKNHAGLLKVMDGVSAVEMSDSAAFALKEDGSLYSWGSNYDGGAGSGEPYTFTFQKWLDATGKSLVPKGYPEHVKQGQKVLVPVKILDGVAQIATDSLLGVALKKNGEIWTWGGLNNQYCDGLSSAVPQKRGTGIARILESSSVAIECLKKDGAVSDLYVGKFDFPLSGQVSDVIYSGLYNFSYALLADGTLWVWGKSGDQEIKKPLKIASSVDRIDMLNSVMLILTDKGVLYSAIDPDSLMKDLLAVPGSQLLDSMYIYKIAEGVSDFSAPYYYYHSLADTFAFIIKPDGSLWTTGGNRYGQQGLDESSFLPAQWILKIGEPLPPSSPPDKDNGFDIKFFSDGAIKTIDVVGLKPRSEVRAYTDDKLLSMFGSGIAKDDGKAIVYSSMLTMAFPKTLYFTVTDPNCSESSAFALPVLTPSASTPTATSGS